MQLDATRLGRDAGKIADEVLSHLTGLVGAKAEITLEILDSFLDQAKAYSSGHLVTHNDVRAMLGVLATDPNASKGLITTTSDFEPRILSGSEFRGHMPYRLELKNGRQLWEWLKTLKGDDRTAPR